MIVLDYKLSEDYIKDLKWHDHATADRTTLDFYIFCGDITFQINDACFDAKWGWVPVLGFAISMYDIVEVLQVKKYFRFYFTESGDELNFELLNSFVKVSANYTLDTAVIKLSEYLFKTVN